MLNPLPELLSFSFAAPLLLRVVVGAYFLKQVWQVLVTNKKKNRGVVTRYLACVEMVGAIAIIIGFWTQIAVIILLATVITNLVLKIKKGELNETKIDFYILLFAILISLLFTGAGFLAIDLPL